MSGLALGWDSGFSSSTSSSSIQSCQGHERPRVKVARDPGHSIGALIIRVGLGGILDYNYNNEPTKPYSNYAGSYISCVPIRRPYTIPTWTLLSHLHV